jgi:hypothetical protein
MLTRLVLMALLLFLGFTALAGGLFVIPAQPVEWLAGTPFPDFTVPAIALSGIGLAAFAAVALLLAPRGAGPLVAFLTGGAIAVFEAVQVWALSLHVWLQALGLEPPGPTHTSIPLEPGGGIPAPLWLQPFYFVFGIVVAALACRLGAPSGLLRRPTGAAAPSGAPTRSTRPAPRARAHPRASVR